MKKVKPQELALTYLNFIILNSKEHEITTAHKTKKYGIIDIFLLETLGQGIHHARNVKMPTLVAI